MMKTTVRIAFAAMTIFAASAQAATVSYSDSVTLMRTNWSETLTIPQFNPSMGTLNSATFTLTGTVSGDAKGESLDAAPADVTFDLAAEVTLMDPTGATIAATLPVVSSVESLAIHDGMIDFGGASGYSSGTVSATDTTMAVLTSSSFLSMFIGSGNITLPIDADGASVASGAGNLITQFGTDAAGDVVVQYEFTPAVPEPSTAALMLMAVVGLLGTTRRRRS